MNNLHGVILAGGSSSRFGSETPKQLMKLSGKSVLWWATREFINSDRFDTITIVYKRHWKKETRAALAEFIEDPRIRFVCGGETRIESSQNGIKGLPENDYVIIHDSARPLLSAELLNSVASYVLQGNIVDVCLQNVDTLVEVSDDTVVSFPDRDKIWRGQTPQGFQVGELRNAWLSFKKSNMSSLPTCDCSLILRVNPEREITVVKGEEINLKITNYEDIDIAESILNKVRPNLWIQKSKGTLTESENIKDKVVLIFGGHTGIGKEISQLVLKEGGRPIPLSRRSGLNAANWDLLESELAKIEQVHGGIDHIVVSAGSLIKAPFNHTSKEDINFQLESNLYSHIAVAHAGYKYLEKSKGSLLLFSSSSYSTAREDYVTYSAAKAAVAALGQGLALEWNGRVRVNVICPERTATDLRKNVFGRENQKSLLSPRSVATRAIGILESKKNGVVEFVRREDFLKQTHESKKLPNPSSKVG